MFSIHKYVLDYNINEVEIPISHKILSVKSQHNQVVLYALVDKNSKLTKKKFYIVGTGWDLPREYAENLNHIGTAIIHDGTFVWHVFTD